MREGIMPLPAALVSTLSQDGVRILCSMDLICLASTEKRDALNKKNTRSLS